MRKPIEWGSSNQLLFSATVHVGTGFWMGHHLLQFGASFSLLEIVLPWLPMAKTALAQCVVVFLRVCVLQGTLRDLDAWTHCCYGVCVKWFIVNSIHIETILQHNSGTYVLQKLEISAPKVALSPISECTEANWWRAEGTCWPHRPWFSCNVCAPPPLPFKKQTLTCSWFVKSN